MNKVIAIGRIVKDIELKYTQNNTPVAQFSLAINSGYGENKRTDFIECIVWRNQAENLHKYCSKGSQIAIEGSLRTSSYEDKEGNKKYITRVNVEHVTFLDSKKEETKEQVSSNQDPFEDFENEIEITDDDLPF